VSFLRPESVDLALQLCDGADYRPGYQISVTRARLRMVEGTTRCVC